MRKGWAILGLLLAVGGLGGCAREYRVINEPIVGGARLSTEEVGTAIKRACASRRWLLRREEPGLLEVSLDKGKAEVTLWIRYSSTSYSIEPVEHRHLRVKKMNEWVRKLQKSIRRFLSDRFFQDGDTDEESSRD